MRRRFVLSAIVGLTLLTLATTRDAEAQRWDGRFYAGWSNASFYGGSKVYGTEDRNGFIAGAAAEYTRTEGDALGFEFGLAYVQKGAKGKIEPNAMDPVQPPISSTFDGEAKMDYVEFSLVFDIHLPMGDKSEIKFGIGPALGFLTSAKAEGTLDGEPVEADIKDYLDNIDFGILMRGGFAYDFERFGLFADVRTNLGAISIDNTPLENDLKTRTVSVLFGIEIPLAQ
jgi:hypothetical protein